MYRSLVVSMLLLTGFAAIAVHAEGNTLRLHSLFTDNMVLQRNQPIQVWGWTTPGTPVSVSLGSRSGQTTSDGEGKWRVILDALPAGGPYELKVTGGDARVLRNILVGDVWICAGQSNMAWSYGSIGHGVRSTTGTQSKETKAFERELAATDRPEIRLYRIPVQGSPTPLEDFIQVEDNPWFPCLQWVPCVPRYAEHFSNVAYHFARALHEATGVPIGLIQTVAGGIPISPYISRATLEADQDFRLLLEADAKAFPADIESVWQAERERWRTLRDQDAQAFYIDTGNTGEGAGWHEPDIDQADWPEVKLPGNWSTTLKARGAVWLRREVTIPEAWKGQTLHLDTGVGNDYQTVYFNGRKVAEEPWREPDFIGTVHDCLIPAELVTSGQAVIAIRLFDYGGGGSLSEPLRLTRGPDSISLAGVWKARVERELDMSILRPWTVGSSQQSAFRAAASFNAAIHPMKGFGLTGAIWYQGEADSKPQIAELYRKLQPAMINDWRRALDQPDLVFLAVQLSTWGQPPQQPENSYVGMLRESQMSVLSLPRAGLVTAVDLGTGEVHPPHKREVGERLARLARSVVHGETLEAYGPMYSARLVSGSRIRVRFRHLGGGLVSKDGQPLRHFAIAGRDRKFVWAQAEIEGDTVVVWSDEVPEPKAVRYGWAANPEGLNLYSRNGLPAFPFRTDDWPME